MTNLFEQAIEKNELVEFALGEGEYFILDREYGGHWVLGSWQMYILPMMKSRTEEEVDPFIVRMVMELIHSGKTDIIKKNDAIVYHLHVYYYYKKEGRIKEDAFLYSNDVIEASLDEYCHFLSGSDKDKAENVKESIELIRKRGGLKR